MKRLLLAALAMVPLAFASIGTTSATEPEEAGWLTPSSSPLVDVTALIPGASTSAGFEVRNPRQQPVTASVRLVGLTSDDNGCNHPETLAGDTTCGAGGGELQDDLVFRLLAVDGEDRRSIGEGVLSALEGQLVSDDVALAVGASRAYVVEYELPASSPNITQTDQLGFDIEVTIEAVASGGARVLGSSMQRRDVVTIVGAELAATGGGLPVVGPAAVLVGLGACLVVAARARNRSVVPIA
jgi:hypothetical protein